MLATARKLEKKGTPIEFSLYCDELLTLAKRAVRHMDKRRIVVRTVVPRMIKVGFTGGESCIETRKPTHAMPEPSLPGDLPPKPLKERQD